MRIFPFIFLATVLWCSAAIGEEQLPDISKMSEEELEALPREIRDNLPIRELSKRGGKTILEANDYFIAYSLSRLMYFNPPPEEQVTQAIRKFQRDLGQQQTGELTFGQFNKLLKRSEQISRNPVYAPGWGDKIFVSIHSDFVSTKGTWILEEDKIFNPINYSNIECLKSRGTCEEIQSEILMQDIGIDMLNVNKNVYEVISWDNSEVISQSGSDCRTTIMTINPSNHEVFQITRNKDDKGCDLAFSKSKLPLLDKPRIAKLKPGWKLSSEFWENRNKEIRKLLNADVQDQFKSITQAVLNLEKERRKKDKQKAEPKESK